MSNIVDLTTERDRRDGPDPEFRATDQFGRPMFLFCADYEQDGSTFSVQFWAYDFVDAERRISSMRNSLVLAGQIYSGIDG